MGETACPTFRCVSQRQMASGGSIVHGLPLMICSLRKRLGNKPRMHPSGVHLLVFPKDWGLLDFFFFCRKSLLGKVGYVEVFVLCSMQPLAQT